MKLTKEIREGLKREIRESLKKEEEIDRIIIFGSFLNYDEINDVDIAVFQHSNEPYLALALKYRRLTRPISKKIPLDILPIINSADVTIFLKEIESGEIIYER